MKTIADFKRAIKVGTKLHTVYHVESKKDSEGKVIYLPDGLPEYTDKDLGVSEVSISQSTQFAVKRNERNSYCSFPKSSEVSFNGNSITIYEDHNRRGRVPVLTYTIID